MRDILVTSIVFIGCFYTLKKPYVGILLWSWLSYMNPHRLSYGFAYTMPFAQIVFMVLFCSMLFSKQKQGLPINSITIPWILFILLMGVTTIFAYYPEEAQTQFVKILKIQLIIFFTIFLITDQEKLKHLIWAIVLSIGYFSVKGGIFTLMTGGAHRVYGPSGSFIEENNSLAIAILMIIPLMIFLRQTESNVWIRRGLLFAIITSLFTVFGSQSRGALLAIIAVAFFYWTKSKGKISSGIIIGILGTVLLLFMPESWYKRMDTIQTYEEDSSAMGRINAWEYAINAANQNTLGLGFESWHYPTFLLYAPIPEDVHVAHSIYFSVLADHGWFGLFLFLLIFFVAWRKLSLVIKAAAQFESLKNIEQLARMLQISFIAYLVGGTFLSLSYFDLPWHLISFVVLLNKFIENANAKLNIATISASIQSKRQLDKLSI